MKIISVDFQREFCSEGGLCYQPRPSVTFVKDSFIPFVRRQGYKVAEIISDYRLPRPGGGMHACVPGQWGYESEIPADVKDENVWVKAFSSPVWIRPHGGDPGQEPGLPYAAPEAFSEWLTASVGEPDSQSQVILVGMTIDCCVLCVLQELRYRGYGVRVLAEGVDTYSGDADEKDYLLKKVVPYWGQTISWEELSGARK